MLNICSRVPQPRISAVFWRDQPRRPFPGLLKVPGMEVGTRGKGLPPSTLAKVIMVEHNAHSQRFLITEGHLVAMNTPVLDYILYTPQQEADALGWIWGGGERKVTKELKKLIKNAKLPN